VPVKSHLPTSMPRGVRLKLSGDCRMFKRSASLTLRAAAYARTALRPLRCWMKMGMDTVYMETGMECASRR
jgi:hypothetical protein